MNRLDLQARLRNFFQNNVYYSGDDLNNSIQDGIDEVVAFSGCVYKSATLTFTANTSYYDLITLFPDYVGLVAMFNNAIKRWMTPISLRKLDQFRIDWETSGGVPYYFVPVNYRYMAIYKKPLVSGYGVAYIFYVAAAPTLTDSTVIPVPEDNLNALEYYNLTDLLEQQQEFGKAGRMFQNYIKNLEGLRTLMKNKRDPDRMLALK